MDLQNLLSFLRFSSGCVDICIYIVSRNLIGKNENSEKKSEPRREKNFRAADQNFTTFVQVSYRI